MRKYLELDYGEMAPEVSVPKGEPISELNDQVRAVQNLETISELTQAIRQCSVYPKLKTVSIINTHFKRDGYNVPARVHLPEGEGPFPVVVFFHGGGFMFNCLDVYDSVHRYITKFGNALVISIDYRFAPENRFPIGLEDSYAGLEWACENAAKYGGDISSLTVCGDSAGGNFAAVVSLMARDKQGPEIHKQILIYPKVSFLSRDNELTHSAKRYAKGYYLESATDEKLPEIYFTNPVDDIKNPYASPLIAESHKGLPPAVIISAECDILIDQAIMYAARLEDEGVPVEFHLFKGMLHGFLNRTYGKTFEALDIICKSIPPL